MGLKILDIVVLDRNLPEHGLRTCDLGAVVHARCTLEVEFVTGSGQTQALLTLQDDDVRATQAEEPASPFEESPQKLERDLAERLLQSLADLSEQEREALWGEEAACRVEAYKAGDIAAFSADGVP